MKIPVRHAILLMLAIYLTMSATILVSALIPAPYLIQPAFLLIHVLSVCQHTTATFIWVVCGAKLTSSALKDVGMPAQGVRRATQTQPPATISRRRATTVPNYVLIQAAIQPVVPVIGVYRACLSLTV